MVQLPEADLKKILADIEELRLNQSSKRRKEPKRVNEHVATLREWNEDLIVGNSGVKQVTNKLGEKSLEIELLTDDGKTIKAPYLEFLNGASPVKVSILKQTATERQVTVETGKKRNPAKGDSFTSEEQEFWVKYVDYVSDIEVLEGAHVGKKLAIDNKFLNM